MNSINRRVFAALMIVLPLTIAQAQPVLTDITVFTSDASGNYTGPDVLDTRPGNDFEPGGSFNLWVRSGGQFLNGPADADARPNIPLSLGIHSFQLLFEPGADFPHFSINLFFNGAVTPSISATGVMLESNGPHLFTFNNSSTTLGVLDDNSTQAAGTLSFVMGGQQVVLTDFFIATPSVFPMDLVNQRTTGASGQNDYVGGITLTVTQVPEPEPRLLAMGFISILAGIRRAGRGRRQ